MCSLSQAGSARGPAGRYFQYIGSCVVHRAQSYPGFEAPQTARHRRSGALPARELSGVLRGNRQINVQASWPSREAAAGHPTPPARLHPLNGQSQFPCLRLRDLNGVDLDLSNCDLRASCFKEARSGRTRLHRSQLDSCRFQQAYLRMCALRDCNKEGSRLEGAPSRRAPSRRDSCS
ncbi:pentapeptide repeat-containing protein [Synechococcus sp. UW140]|uniref:pentapeptide repeat-containing protein n=1 Tax=Synechococcus sp. UW140 TaxID=368503 RepID=UPI003458CC74